MARRADTTTPDLNLYPYSNVDVEPSDKEIFEADKQACRTGNKRQLLHLMRIKAIHMLLRFRLRPHDEPDQVHLIPHTADYAGDGTEKLGWLDYNKTAAITLVLCFIESENRYEFKPFLADSLGHDPRMHAEQRSWSKWIEEKEGLGKGIRICAQVLQVDRKPCDRAREFPKIDPCKKFFQTLTATGDGPDSLTYCVPFKPGDYLTLINDLRGFTKNSRHVSHGDRALLEKYVVCMERNIEEAKSEKAASNTTAAAAAAAGPRAPGGASHRRTTSAADPVAAAPTRSAAAPAGPPAPASTATAAPATSTHTAATPPPALPTAAEELNLRMATLRQIPSAGQPTSTQCIPAPAPIHPFFPPLTPSDLAISASAAAPSATATAAQAAAAAAAAARGAPAPGGASHRRTTSAADPVAAAPTRSAAAAPAPAAGPPQDSTQLVRVGGVPVIPHARTTATPAAAPASSSRTPASSSRILHPAGAAIPTPTATAAPVLGTQGLTSRIPLPSPTTATTTAEAAAAGVTVARTAIPAPTLRSPLTHLSPFGPFDPFSLPTAHTTALTATAGPPITPSFPRNRVDTTTGAGTTRRVTTAAPHPKAPAKATATQIASPEAAVALTPMAAAAAAASARPSNKKKSGRHTKKAKRLAKPTFYSPRK